MTTKRIQEMLATAGCNLPEPSELVAWAQLVERTGIVPACMAELVEMGWVEPVRTQAEEYLFRTRDVYRIQKLLRLVKDLDISLAGASIIVDLVTRIEELENEVAALRRLL